MRYQDDPKKCTAARLLKAGIADKTRHARGSRKIILNPYSSRMLMPKDRRTAGTLVGIDCSWRLADSEFEGASGRRGRPAYEEASSRSLPPLLAGNPVNYSKIGMLTTAEALAAALFIMGYDETGHAILGRFGWGHTFFDLNCNMLAEYAHMSDRQEAESIASEYGLIRL